MRFVVWLILALAFAGAARAQDNVGMINTQSGTTYTFKNTDCDPEGRRIVVFSNAGGAAATLPQAGGSSGFSNGCVLHVLNGSPGTVTITPQTSTINGVSSISLVSGSATAIYTSGSGAGAGVYYAVIQSNNQQSSGNALFFVSAYCNFSPANPDVGPCINTVIAAAAAAGGGTVFIPAGTYNVATAITQTTSGVHLQGAGSGIPRDNQSPNSFLAITKLVWTGATGGTMALIGPSTTSSVTLSSADVTGIVFDCASLANICIEINQVYHSLFDFGVSEPRTIGAWILATNSNDGPGIQDNDFWIESRSTSATYSPTGIMLDSASGSNWNVSYNRFRRLYAWYNKGDGIVFGDSDNNILMDLATYPNTGATGSGIVFAAKGYISPNGISTNNFPYATRILHTGSVVNVQGYPSGATLTASGGNVGSVSFAALSLTTNSTPSAGSINLNFASTTGAAPWMNTKCGNPSNGVINDDAVSTVVNGTLLQLVYPLITTPSGNITCAFGWGTTSSAVAGTYTITAASSSTYNITAPANGHTQSGISASGGVLTFTDIVLPISGTPTTGDSWTIVVPPVPNTLNFEFVDKANSVPNPHFGVGASGTFSTSTQPWPTSANPTTGINMPFYTEGCSGKIQSVGQFAVNIGNCAGNGTTGTYSSTIGGISNGATGFGSFAIGGNGNAAPGTYSGVHGQSSSAGGTSSFAFGTNNATTGNYSFALGNQATDRGRISADCFGSGDLSSQGDAQTCVQVLRNTGVTASAFRLTADQGAAGSANCVNIPNNTAYQLFVDIVAFDHTTVTKNEAWSAWTGLLTRGANAASTAVTMASTPTPITNGTVTGSSIAATADTTNGCLNISFTPPTGNTDTWNAVARVRTVEVQ